MGSQRVALVGDMTTTGGRIITGENNVRSEGVATALVGDKVSCPKCKQIGTIVEGCPTFIVLGKPAAYNGCLIACGCPVGTNRIIATNSFMFVDDSNTPYTIPVSAHTNTTKSNWSSGQVNHRSNSSLSSGLTDSNNTKQQNNQIRIDAKELIQCAEELCEKHLYYPEIKQAFMDDITTFAQQIVAEVEAGQKSYEQGRSELKTEEKSLEEQAKDWFVNGISIFGGIGLTMAGFALCTTGVGCAIGAFMVGHGANGIEEGIRGIIAGDSNQSGFLKDTYKSAARGLGFDEEVGELAYNLVDLGLSVHGKLKLVPKINEYGNPLRKLFYFGRKDLEMAYKQMRKYMLVAEIIGDAYALSGIVQKANNLFILDKNTGQTNMVIGNPEGITNVGEIVENCTLHIKITGREDDEPAYYSCINAQGEQYKKPF